MNINKDNIYNIFNVIDKEHCVFVSGHRDITEDEFNKNYRTELKINKIIGSTFVIGDYNGLDIMAQNYLMDELELSPSKIFIFHMGEKPMNINPKITQTVSGFNTDEERDAAMTDVSSKDIAFVRDNTSWSGTGQNILRRYKIKN